MPEAKHNPFNWFDTHNRRGAWRAYREIIDNGGNEAEALAAARSFLETRGISEEEIQVILDALFTGPDPQPPP